MKAKHICVAVSLLAAGLAWADSDNRGGNGWGQGSGGGQDHGLEVPEIDGGLAVQMITLVGGVLYLLKRKK